MKNIGTLYGFELKKILKNRLTIAMLAILLILTVIEGMNFGDISNKEDWEAQKTLNGRLIDDSLLNEMYPLIDEYGKTWKYENMQYFGVAYVERNIVADNTPLAEYSSEDMYAERENYLHDAMIHDGLSEKEVEWWKKYEDGITKPFTFIFKGGSVDFAQGLVGICMCIMMIAAMCISTVFTAEHRQRTDQIVLSCRKGRKETYFAKIAAGLTIVLGSSFLATGLFALIVYFRKGLDGFNAIVQMEIPLSGYDLTMGQFVTIQLVIMVTAGILFAVFAMAVSELIRNSLAVMGIMVGLFIFSQIEIIPDGMRLLSQIRSMIPSNLISLSSLMDSWLVGFGGHYVTQYAACPVIYMVISVVLIIVGAVAYDRFQVTGR